MMTTPAAASTIDEPIMPPSTTHGRSGVPRHRLSTPSSRRIGTVLARPVNVADTAVNAARPPT